MSVQGAHDKVEDCIDYLLNLEEEILQELADREDDERYIPQQQKFKQQKEKKSNNSVSLILLSLFLKFDVIFDNFKIASILYLPFGHNFEVHILI